MVCATITRPNGDILNINFDVIEQPFSAYQQFRVRMIHGGVANIGGTPQVMPFRVVVSEGYNELFLSLLDRTRYAFSMMWMGDKGYLVKAENVYFLDETDPTNPNVHILYPKSFKVIFPDQEIR